MSARCLRHCEGRGGERGPFAPCCVRCCCLCGVRRAAAPVEGQLCFEASRRWSHTPACQAGEAPGGGAWLAGMSAGACLARPGRVESTVPAARQPELRRRIIRAARRSGASVPAQTLLSRCGGSDAACERGAGAAALMHPAPPTRGAAEVTRESPHWVESASRGRLETRKVPAPTRRNSRAQEARRHGLALETAQRIAEPRPTVALRRCIAAIMAPRRTSRGAAFLPGPGREAGPCGTERVRATRPRQLRSSACFCEANR